MNPATPRRWLRHLGGAVLVAASLGWLLALPLLPLHSRKPVTLTWEPPPQTRHLLVFFGYAGCASVCPPHLRSLALSYDQYQARYRDQGLGIVFCNLLAATPAETVAAYAHGFHPGFSLCPGDPSDNEGLQRALGVSYSAMTARELAHSSYIYLLRRESDGAWLLRAVYPDPAALETRLWKDLAISPRP